MDYTFEFSDLSSEYTPVKITHCSRKRQFELGVCIDDRAYAKTTSTDYLSIYGDLVDLAAAIYVADRLAPRKQPRGYDLLVTLPLRNPAVFEQSKNRDALCQLLQWYTQDRWHFDFVLRSKVGRQIERQPRLLSWTTACPDCEIALWSGGLDSLAGLWSRIGSCSADRYALLGSGSNLQIQSRQLEIIDRSKVLCRVSMDLVQVPIRLKYIKSDLPKNDASRVRGLTFKMLGSVCAMLEGQQKLHIYENGFGALNLPFQLSEVGPAHTKAVHPQSLIYGGKFISQLLNIPFHFVNPFLYMTKAQMCSALIDKTHLAFRTISCDGRFRREGQPSQCGYCSSCLLRRVALLNAFGWDDTEYVVTHGRGAGSPRLVEHFDRMQYQVKRLDDILTSPDPWKQLLKRYDEMLFLVDEIAATQGVAASTVAEQLLTLYHVHVMEWQNVQEMIEPTLCKRT